jgi:RNA polymerase sigma-70 factor (ECF subfamily)
MRAAQAAIIRGVDDTRAADRSAAAGDGEAAHAGQRGSGGGDADRDYRANRDHGDRTQGTDLDSPVACTDSDSDEALMLAYAAGDAGAFARLYARHERPLYRFLRRSLDDDAGANELLQETWLSVVRNAAGYVPSARFTTWLFGIARSRLIDHWRARRPQLSLDEPVADGADEALIDHLPADERAQPDAQALSRAQRAALLRAVEALPPAQREVFLLHADGALTLAEIGALTGVGMETAKSRLRYALARLRQTLAAWR